MTFWAKPLRQQTPSCLKAFPYSVKLFGAELIGPIQSITILQWSG
jgi:hypothetical protein